MGVDTMPGRRTEHSTVAVPKERATKVTHIVGAVRARLRTIFPDANAAELDSFTDRVLYYAREARKHEREVPVPKRRKL